MISGAGVLDGERFALRGRGVVQLGADGFEHPRSRNGRRRTTTRYADLTHLALTRRAAWIATRRGLLVLPREAFEDAHAPERLMHALALRVRALPGGEQQLARMERVDARGRRPVPRSATRGLAALCIVGWFVELAGDPLVHAVGAFSTPLVEDGDLWRIVTANFLHGFPLHLVLNLVGLLALGRLAERALGSARTLCVMGASALGAMAASGLVHRGDVVGVSGVVFGLAGAVLWLELRRGEELPAWWRFTPAMRRLAIGAVAADVALGFVIPIIAGEAHVGGFAAGLLATAALTPRGRFDPPAAARPLAAAVLGATLLAVAAAGWEAVRDGDFAARHATRLARLPGIEPGELNNQAWFIAIDPHHTREQLDAALLLARRAVDETSSHEPTFLDTLAEVLFQLGRAGDAVAAIDLAIAQESEDPWASYYREQRRRFTGERAADDRPEDPGSSFAPRRPPLPPDEEGVTV